jgi:hypothetical protein
MTVYGDLWSLSNRLPMIPAFKSPTPGTSWVPSVAVLGKGDHVRVGARKTFESLQNEGSGPSCEGLGAHYAL